MLFRSDVRIDRADLERVCSAATAYAVLQRVAEQRRIAVPAPVADLDALEQAVIRTRRLLGWRR